MSEVVSRPLVAPAHHHDHGAMVRPHHRTLPMKVGTRASPLALYQTRHFLSLITQFCPLMRGQKAFEEHQIITSGDAIQSRRLAEIGGKGLFAKEIHEALLDGRVDFAVHSLKDLETELPPGIVLACVLEREDARDAIILGAGMEDAVDPGNPLASLPHGALIGTSSVRRQAQLLAVRPDLRIGMMRGNVQTRLARVHGGHVSATLLAIAGLKRLGMEREADLVLEPEIMVPSACQGIIGITVREDDDELRELLGAIQHFPSMAVAQAERGLLGALDGSCRTPIGAYARLLPGGRMKLTGLIARADGSFLLKREVEGLARDGARMGRELGLELGCDSPADVFG